jgi:AAA ATPase-like protein
MALTCGVPPKSASSLARGGPLIGRAAECGELDSLLEALRRGESRSLVIRGEAGVGKTALLGYLTERAADCRIISVTAVQGEMELAFAALHQLCAPMLDELEVLPAPQREALGITFGLREGPVPDRFLVGLALLTVLAEAAEQRPLVCLVDDEQWLDRASAQVPADELTGLPQLVIEGLRAQDARAGVGPADAIAGAADRWRGGSGVLRTVDCAPWPYWDAGRARPRPPPLRRMAAPPAPSCRRPGSAAHSPRHARGDGDGGLRRARQARVAGGRGESTKARCQQPERTDGSGGPGRSASLRVPSSSTS